MRRILRIWSSSWSLRTGISLQTELEAGFRKLVNPSQFLISAPLFTSATSAFWAPWLMKDAYHIAPKLWVYRSNHREWAALLWGTLRKWTWNGQSRRCCHYWSSCMWLRQERISSYTKSLGIKEGSPQSRKTVRRVSTAEEKLQKFWELDSSKK